MFFKVINLGCKVNRAESDSVEFELEELGMSEADKDCDIVVINTCTVTAIAEKKTRKTVRGALTENPRARVIVTGCAAAQHASVYKGMSDRVEVVLKWDLKEYLHSLRLEFGSSLKEAKPDNPGRDKAKYCRANVKVQDGCINKCAYCIIHELRGPEVSIDPKQVLERVNLLTDSGITEVILSGINLGRYNHNGTQLAKLCEILLEGESRCRFRLSSIEPDNLSDDVIEVVADSNGRICKHFHLPLQSGCDKTLKNMNRNYSTKDYLDVVNEIRDHIPTASISTDVICGFPGESDEDFRETIRFCKEIGFSKMHVFPFSPRKGTPAFDMKGQVDHHEKSARAKELREVAKILRSIDLEKRAGTTETAVVEDEEWCMSESYHRIKAPKGAACGSFVEVAM